MESRVKICITWWTIVRTKSGIPRYLKRKSLTQHQMYDISFSIQLEKCFYLRAPRVTRPECFIFSSCFINKSFFGAGLYNKLIQQMIFSCINALVRFLYVDVFLIMFLPKLTQIFFREKRQGLLGRVKVLCTLSSITYDTRNWTF